MIKNIELMAAYKLENGIAPETPMLTFARWKAAGYSVKKGEHGAKVTLWKYKAKQPKAETEEEAIQKGYCFLKTCVLFTPNQVEKIVIHK